MLASFYSIRSQVSTVKISSPYSLSDRVIREGAKMCVEAAQKITSLIMETLEPNESIGLIPWWYRLYFLHIAGTTFLAAMFGPELFTESVAKSWEDNIATLHAHEHLSQYVEQCIFTFETLSTKILETRFPRRENTGNISQDVSDESCVGNLFQDEGFEFDNFLFGMDDILKFQHL